MVLSAGIRSPVQKPKERTLIGPAEAPLNRATSSRNAGRNHFGTPSEIKSEWGAKSSRIRGRLPPESALLAMIVHNEDRRGVRSARLIKASAPVAPQHQRFRYRRDRQAGKAADPMPVDTHRLRGRAWPGLSG